MTTPKHHQPARELEPVRHGFGESPETTETPDDATKLRRKREGQLAADAALDEARLATASL